MKNQQQCIKTIGLIEGGGTGPELAKIFEKVVSKIYKQETGNSVEFLSFEKLFGYNPHTFWDLKDHYYNKSYSYVKKICEKEVNDILKYNKIFLRKNGVGMFRTAINAETLYYLRRKAKSIKVAPITLKKKNKKVDVLFIRDQIQGYYTTEKIESTKKILKITSLFSEKNFELILSFVKNIIPQIDSKFKNSTILFFYKFHIMGIELQKMIDCAVKKTSLKQKYLIMQPDSGLHFILHDIYNKKTNPIIVICGNEIGDTLLETLIHYYNLGTKENFFTSNFVLGADGVEALQTMHGSADDIAGKGIVNPTATLKAAAHALEKWLKVPNAVKKMEKVLDKAFKNKITTKDMGGRAKTNEIVNFVINNF